MDSVAPGSTPKQAASLFPEAGTRTLRLVGVNGSPLPAVYYTAPDHSYDGWVDSATITFQADSLVVVRSYLAAVYPSGAAHKSGQSGLHAQSGRAEALGDQLLTYTNGAGADTATLRPDGTLAIRFWTHDPSAPTLPLGEWMFSPKYDGPVMNPIPTVSSLSPATMPQYGAPFTLTINGSGFVPQTTVSWAAVAGLPITYVSPTQITVQVPSSFLNSTETDWVFVENPQPGGGSTHGTFTTVNPAPRLASLDATQALAGSGPIRLTLTGDNFSQATVGRVNGAARPTTCLSRTQLAVTLAASDLAGAGTLSIDAMNPTPGGGVTQTLPFTVSGTPPKLLSQVTSDVLNPVQVVADPIRPLLYVTIGSTSPVLPNTVAALDESTGNVAWTVPIAGSPSKLAISDDGQYLYVGALQDSAITRIVLATHTPELRIELGETTIPGATHPFPYRTGVIAVVPGQPHTIVVGREVIGLTPSDVGLSIWDDATMRPQSTAGHDYAGSFAFGATPATLYGPQWGSTLGAMFAMTIDASGAHDVMEKTGVLPDTRAQFVYASGRLYGSDALVIDPATLQAIGHLAGFGVSDVIAASTDGRTLYTVDQTGRILAADATTYDAQGSVAVSNAGGGATGLTRWGTNGLAFIAAGRVFIIRADFVH